MGPASEAPTRLPSESSETQVSASQPCTHTHTHTLSLNMESQHKLYQHGTQSSTDLGAPRFDPHATPLVISVNYRRSCVPTLHLGIMDHAPSKSTGLEFLHFMTVQWAGRVQDHQAEILLCLIRVKNRGYPKSLTASACLGSFRSPVRCCQLGAPCWKHCFHQPRAHWSPSQGARALLC